MAGISDKALKSNYAENKYRFQKQELQNHEFSDGSGLEMYEFKYRFEDDQTGRFSSIDPLANDYVYNSPYAFSENKVTGHVELEGLEARSIISGETTTGASGWVATAISGDAPTTMGPGEAVVAATGAFFSGAWHGMVNAWNMIFPSAPAPSVPSAPSASNSGSSTNQATGARRQNWIPDQGAPNSTQTNRSGTTTKKYGPEGNVQKEYNDGHGKNAPANEQDGHVHDYKPNPLNPTGRGTRMPGRPPKPNELLRDFNRRPPPPPPPAPPPPPPPTPSGSGT